jgi:hypothetical protein
MKNPSWPEALKRAEQEIERLRARNAELRAVLRDIERICVHRPSRQIASAAIAKAEGK